MQHYTGSGYIKFTSIKHLYDILVMYSEKITHNVIAELIVRFTTNGHRLSTISTNPSTNITGKGCLLAENDVINFWIDGRNAILTKIPRVGIRNLVTIECWC